MVKAFVLIFCSFIFLGSLAQQKITDSLLYELKMHPQEDTVRLSLLNQLSSSYRDVNPGNGIETANKAIVLAQKLKSNTQLALAFSNKGANYQSNDKDSLAIMYYQDAINILQNSNEKKETAKLLYNIGFIYQKSNYFKAIEYHKNALAIFKQLHDSDNIASTLRSIGIDYHYISDYPQALEYLQQALMIFEKTGNKRGVGDVFNNMGLVYTYLSDSLRSFQYTRKALKIYEQLDYKKGTADVLGNLGNLYDNIDDSANALDCYRRALEINSAIQNKRGIASALSNMGIVYDYYDNYPEGFRYISKALDFYEQSGDKINAAITLNELAKICANIPEKFLAKIGINNSNRYDKSIAYNGRSIALAKQAGSVIHQYFGWETLSTIYEKQKDYPEALDAYRKSVVLKDSALNDRNKKEILRLEMQYDFNKREDSISAENSKSRLLAAATIKQEKTVKNFVIAGAVILVISSIVVFIFYKRRRDAEEQKHAAEFKAKAIDNELRALRAQMNPHFIFNSLNSITDYIDKHDTKTATLYTTKFAKLMRRILENSEQKEVPVVEDLKALELYMQLEALRLNNKFTYEIIVDDNIDQQNTLIPPLILQPFVENSIWHGISKKEGEGKIWIHIQKKGNMINCTVRDNGIGIHETALSEPNNLEKKSMGMKITRSRIEVINKLKRSNAAVTMSNLEEGTEVEVEFPVEMAF